MSQIIRWTISASFYHFQNMSGKSEQKVNWIRLFVSFQWKIYGSDETSVFSGQNVSNGKFHLLKPISKARFKRRASAAPNYIDQRMK